MRSKHILPIYGMGGQKYEIGTEMGSWLSVSSEPYINTWLSQDLGQP